VVETERMADKLIARARHSPTALDGSRSASLVSPADPATLTQRRLGQVSPLCRHSAREIPYHNGETRPTRAALLRGKMRDLPDFAAIRCNRCRGENAKIHDEHLAAPEAYVNWFVEAFEAVVRTIRF
jgi:hypothetical protein